jgi:uncharacterized protein involved in exopolysaccharide biosynthesis
MAVQIEQQGQLQEFLAVLSRRKWQILLPTLVCASLGAFLAVIVPKKYVTSTQVELRPVSVAQASKEPGNAPFQIKAMERVKKVVTDLQNREYLALSPDAQRDFLEDVQEDIKVVTSSPTLRGTTFVTIEYADVRREWAAEFLKALREDWIADVVDGDRRRATFALESLRTERRLLEKQQKSQEEGLTNLRRQHGLSATQPAGGGARERAEDPVYARLKSNETERDKISRSLQALDVEIAQLELALQDLPPTIASTDVVPGESNATQLGEVEGQIAAAQAKLKGIKPSHSQYIKTQLEIRGLEERRDQLLRQSTKAQIVAGSRPNPDLEPARKVIEDKKRERAVSSATLERLESDISRDRLAAEELQDVYREERERMGEIARLQEKLLAIDKKLMEKGQEVDTLLSPLSNPFSITAEVWTPQRPTEPNPWMILSFGIVLGLALGVGSSLLGEFSRSCFRGVADISRVMVVPVLGAVDRIVTQAEARTLRMRRTWIGASSLAVAASVVFVTWAWAYDAQLLAPSLREAIEQLREALR